MEETRKPRIRAIDRQQLVLRPVDVERLVGEDHPVRAVWDFVGRLDLRALYGAIAAVDGAPGRAAIDPRLLVSLWIYAYSEGISSAREIERLCAYHPAYQWLTGLEPVSHHTLSDFRVDQQVVLDELFAQVLGVLSAEGLITLERVMHDGTKVRAQAGADTFRREARVQAWLEVARQQVAAMGDPRADESQRVAKARHRALRERTQKLEQALEELAKVRASKPRGTDPQQARVSGTDPEARMMKQADGGYVPSYNVQVSTDAVAGAIVGIGATQAGSDYRQLPDSVDRIEANLRAVPKQMVVDGGFMSRATIVAMQARGIEVIGPLLSREGRAAAQLKRRGVMPEFWPQAFVYDATRDQYTCPAGKTLAYERQERAGRGRTLHSYRAAATDCAGCAFRPRCCPGRVKGRSVCRAQDDPIVAAFVTKMATESAKAIYRQRGAIAEFSNLRLKAKLGLREFRLRGLRKVTREALWAALTHNVGLWIRLRWRPMGAARSATA